MAKQNYDYDVIVIGSGSGGSTAATIAARKGHRVAIVEMDVFGGDSPNYSDIPLRALTHAGGLLYEARRGARFGLRTTTVGYNYPTLTKWKEIAIQRTGSSNSRAHYQQLGIATISGYARFVSPNEITVNHKTITAERFVIATGSEWVAPDIPGLRDCSYETPRTILQKSRPPKSIYIIGGGTTGVELAQLLAILGVSVTLAETTSRLVPDYEEEVGVLMDVILKKHLQINILTNTRTVQVEQDAAGKKITYTKAGKEIVVRAEEIIVASDRQPRLDIGLENANISYTQRGIIVNDYLQTSQKHIYAAGDVAGKSQHTHTAIIESKVAGNNMFAKKLIQPNYNLTPKTITTIPEVASVGLSEDDCIQRDLAINTGIAPLSLIGRSNVSDMREGFVKIITNKKNIIIGGTVMAPNASDMIHELSLAMSLELSVEQLAKLPHVHLSWSEAIRAAALQIINK